MPEWTSLVAARLASLRLSPAREREIIEELSQHLDDAYAEFRAGGLSEQAAMQRAVDEIDERDLLAREMQPLRQAHVSIPLPPGTPARGAGGLRGDVAYAVRTFARTPGWTLVVLLLLAVGIGANTALFSATDALLFAPIPGVSDPDSLVRVRWTGRNDMATDLDEYGYNRPLADGREVRSSVSYTLYRQLAQDAAPQAELAACAPFGDTNLGIDGQAELADGIEVSGNYFSMLGVRAPLGRVLTPDDDRPAAAPVGVISHRYWQTRFGSSRSLIGKVVTANGVAVTIVGVLPASFTGVQEPLATSPDIFFPLELDRQIKGSTGRASESALASPTAWWLEVVGRLHPGVTAAQLEAALQAPFAQTARGGFAEYVKSLPEARREAAGIQKRTAVPQLLVDSARRGVYDVYTDAITASRVLSAVVAVILLIVCANVANLLLSRAVARRKEISIRLSLGATRARLMRQMLTEALLLAVAGAALDLLVAWWGIRLLPAPASTAPLFHAPVLLFALGAAVATSLLFGVVPAVRATRVDVNTALKEQGRGVAGVRSAITRTLLVVQVALSIVLLVGAGLFVTTLMNLRRVDLGFDPTNLLLVKITPEVSGYDQPRTRVLYGALLERLSGLPGVRGAALAQPALLSGSTSSTDIYLQGQPAPADPRDRTGHEIDRVIVSPEFFRVYGIPIVRGRGLTDHDGADAPHVALINEAAVQRFFHGADPLGQRFGGSPEKSGDTEIIGVVKDAKYASVRDAAPPTLYVSYLQNTRASTTIALRTAGSATAEAPAVRAAIHDIDPDLPVAAMSTQSEQIELRFKQERLFADAYTLFGAVALLLASIGLFGLMSYTVARRTPEMGVRMALGAQRIDVLRLVMRESLALVTIGVACGVAAALATGRLVSNLLFGLAPSDPRVLTVAVITMLAVAAAAAYVPARRASRVDPMAALRTE